MVEDGTFFYTELNGFDIIYKSKLIGSEIMESQLSGSWQDWVGVAGYVLFAGFIVWRVLTMPAN